jgi:CheY-like chemotaxis protein
VTTTLDESIARGVVDMWSAAVMDVQMPNMDGFEAASAIRRREKDRSHIAIIALTAHAMKGDRERCLAAGMDAYISKPIRVQELNDAIEKLAITRAEIPAA